MLTGLPCHILDMQTFGDSQYTVQKIWQIFVGKEEEVPCRENFTVILGK
jgi:hypothetical protein